MKLRASDRPAWWRERAWSFRHALRGVGICLRTQANARVHAVATVATVAAGLWLAVSRWEWCFLIGAIAIVWTAETFNTALEFLVDLVSPGQHPLAGQIKDVAAAAVLMAAVGALAIGGMILVPKLWLRLVA